MSTVRPLAGRISSPLRTIRLIRYSSTTPPLIKSQVVPAPNSGTIRILSLNRPEARNAISRALLDDLRSHIDGIAHETTGRTRAVIIASESDACFCAGADLKERRTFTEEQTASFLSNLRDTFTSIEQLKIPTIAAVASTAFGGGLELALTTTLRVFSATSTVALPETRLAIIPGAGGTYRLQQIIGQRRALDLILTGRRITGPEAYFLGLANRLVDIPDDEIQKPDGVRKRTLGEAISLATEICGGGPIAIEAALEAVRGNSAYAENDAYGLVVNTEDRNEALKAFNEKRKPVFRGR